MAKSRSHRHKSRKHRSRRNRMRGGYSSASTYGMYVNGTTGDQWSRTMDQTGPYGKIPGNLLIGAQGQNVPSPSQMPTSSQLSLVQKAGRRRKRGGFLGEVVNQAIVPLSILGMQQTFRKKRGGSHTRRHRKY